ncbi:LOW QUALITY PROTEIN: inter-alpha-trypsin inhibitor heavy chain H4-like [Oculina patagonica]
MRSYLFSLAFLLIFTKYASTKSFTADLDPSLSRHPRDVQSATVLTPLSLHVASKISSRFANTLVTSTLENKSPKKQEAKFVVQLSDTAFISNFSMVVNGKHYIGKVKEKDAAKDEYEKAKNDSRNSGLVSSSEQAVRGMDVFVIAINVAPNSSAEFRLNYQQLLVRRKGDYEQVISIRPKQIVPVLKVVVDIEEPQALSYVDVMKIRKNPSDKATKGNPLAVVTKPSPKSAHIEYSPSEDEQRNLGSAGIDGDFIIRYDVAHGNDAGIIQILGSHFVQYFSPSGLNPLAKNIVFVIDISGSMGGQKIEQTRQAMFTILNQLRTSDSFNIVLFNAGTVQWRSSASLATSDNIQAGRAFVDERVKAGGGTNINDALILGLQLLRNTVNSPVVLFLTDGDPTAGETNTKTIRANVRKANDIEASIFALGFGSSLNFDFLTALSVENGGSSRRIYTGKDAASQLEGFYDEISTPLLLQVRFEYPTDIVDDSKVTASAFSQYYDGSELVVSGKIKEGVTSSRLMSVNVRGKSGSNPVTYTLSRTLQNLTVPSDKVLNEDFTERLWAYMRIKQLLIKLLITDDTTEKARLKKQALQMSLQYNFVTPLTSFVVVQSDSFGEEESRARGGLKRNSVPDSNDQSAGLSPSAGWKLSSFGLPIPLIFLSFVRFCVY